MYVYIHNTISQLDTFECNSVVARFSNIGLVPVKRTPVNKGLESLIFGFDFKNVCNGLRIDRG